MPANILPNTGANVYDSESMLFQWNGVPTNGTSGTFAGIAAKGSLLTDKSGGGLYSNQGTQNSPTWTQITIP